MNSQRECFLPTPIIEVIISFSELEEKLSFRQTCKLFSNKLLPIFTSTLCNTMCWYGALDSGSNILYLPTSIDITSKIELSSKEGVINCGTVPGEQEEEVEDIEDGNSQPLGLALNEKEKILFVSDSENQVIKSVNLIDGRVETIYGNPMKPGFKDGIENEAEFCCPDGLVLDSISNHLYVVDSNNHAIRRIILNERRVETICGFGESGYLDGSFEESKFMFPYGIEWNSSTQELYVSDGWNYVIRVISMKNRRVRTLCGTPQQYGFKDGIHNESKFRRPSGMGLDTLNNCLYVADHGNDTVRKVSLIGEVRVSTLCGTKGKKGSRDGLFPMFDEPFGIIVDPHSQALYVTDKNGVRKVIDRTRGYPPKT